MRGSTLWRVGARLAAPGLRNPRPNPYPLCGGVPPQGRGGFPAPCAAQPPSTTPARCAGRAGLKPAPTSPAGRIPVQAFQSPPL
ncbi:MAG: hypothetical protein LBM98_03740 [Oscillospiraceae bacterium]|nr:hypothetical protein [Oscillospiraceae bacterium]